MADDKKRRQQSLRRFVTRRNLGLTFEGFERYEVTSDATEPLMFGRGWVGSARYGTNERGLVAQERFEAYSVGTPSALNAGFGWATGAFFGTNYQRIRCVEDFESYAVGEGGFPYDGGTGWPAGTDTGGGYKRMRCVEDFESYAIGEGGAPYEAGTGWQAGTQVGVGYKRVFAEDDLESYVVGPDDIDGGLGWAADGQVIQFVDDIDDFESYSIGTGSFPLSGGTGWTGNAATGANGNYEDNDDDFESYSVGTGSFPLSGGSGWTGDAAVAANFTPPANDVDEFESYAVGTGDFPLSDGTGWTGDAVTGANFTPPVSIDEFESYSVGTGSFPLSGGTGWTGNAVTGENQIDTRLWLDGSDGSTLFTTHDGSTNVADTDAVGRWEDKSPYANHATQSNASIRPVFATGVQNGLSAVLMDAASVMSFASDMVSGTSYTFIFVLRAPVQNHAAVAVVLKASSDGAVYIRNTGTQIQTGRAAALATGVLPTWVDTGCVISVVRDGSSVSYYYNGTVMSTSGTNFFSAGSDVTLGDASSGGIEGHICEIRVMSNVLNEPIRQGIESDLATKWGITF